jgi:hypothetical protein
MKQGGMFPVSKIINNPIVDAIRNINIISESFEAKEECFKVSKAFE